jgi:hypothetical protein
MIGYFVTVWEEPPNRDVMIGMIRSACTAVARAVRVQASPGGWLLDAVLAAGERMRGDQRW